jgi:hypothetical protein
VHFAGCTPHPDNAWIAQQSRQVMWELDEREPSIRFLIRDNDQKFNSAFDTVFRSAGIEVIPIPHHAPNANAFAERWIRSVREECLDKALIINQAHLRRVMREYVTFFNTARPHQGIDQQILVPPASRAASGPVRCRNVLRVSFMTTTATLRRRKPACAEVFLGYGFCETGARADGIPLPTPGYRSAPLLFNQPVRPAAWFGTTALLTRYTRSAPG